MKELLRGIKLERPGRMQGLRLAATYLQQTPTVREVSSTCLRQRRLSQSAFDGVSLID
jgi:hypothetical protein